MSLQHYHKKPWLDIVRMIHLVQSPISDLKSTFLYDWIKVEICIRRALYMYRLFLSSFVSSTFPLGISSPSQQRHIYWNIVS
ncbi:hypothetical protein EYC80_001416 [Monilinia laxa]|uniref:Uncharacterized protein n=1 Tax=Monilinia laxa TaxID=61186 RepID=A0A5N6K9E2_MONLA|nr:hypothetical protein EYC80_001416 [Monilinia laxa]